MTQDIVGQALSETFRALTRYERRPFMAMLAEMLDCKPTPAAIRAFAEKSPDRWAQAVSIIAGLAGFDRGVGPSINIYNVGAMSDVELAKRLAELDKLAAAKDVSPKPLDVAYIEHSSADAAKSPPDANYVAPKLGSQSPNVGIPEREQTVGSYVDVPTFLPIGNIVPNTKEIVPNEP
jgi:hypothetical protein